MNKSKNGVIRKKASNSTAKQIPDPLDATSITILETSRQEDKHACIPPEITTKSRLYKTIFVAPHWTADKSAKTISIQDVQGLILPSASCCHVFLTCPQEYLPDAFGLMDAWRLKYQRIFVVHLPENNCKKLVDDNLVIVIHATKGAPPICYDRGLRTCVSATGTNSLAAFCEMIKGATIGPRAIMFGQAVDGFDTFESCPAAATTDVQACRPRRR